MQEPKMNAMATAQVVQLPRRAPRPHSPHPPHRAAEAPCSGRAWINGREVGGTNPRYDHLSIAHD
jgi:hypothetical protein